MVRIGKEGDPLEFGPVCEVAEADYRAIPTRCTVLGTAREVPKARHHLNGDVQPPSPPAEVADDAFVRRRHGDYDAMDVPLADHAFEFGRWPQHAPPSQHAALPGGVVVEEAHHVPRGGAGMVEVAEEGVSGPARPYKEGALPGLALLAGPAVEERHLATAEHAHAGRADEVERGIDDNDAVGKLKDLSGAE